MKKMISLFIFALSTSLLLANNFENRDSTAKIQLCLILDVSGSMSGLLSQAQNEIWKTISFLENFEKDSLETIIELAVLSFGNVNYDKDGHVKLISEFTNEIDIIAEKLWVMETGGGNEYCGMAIKKSLDSLSWGDETVFKCIVMAGNEPFDQGQQNYKDAIKEAIEKGILINTVYCGNIQEGIFNDWENASVLGKGAYANINQQISMEEFKTPYDQKLVQFYFDFKSTYFENEPIDKKTNQFHPKGEISPEFRDRVIYKFSRIKKEKDIIDHFNDHNWDIDKIDKSKIPEKWKTLTKKQLKFKLLEYSRKRKTYQEGFELYSKKVQEFLQISVQPNLHEKTLNLAISEMIMEQLKTFGFKDKRD